ncbi:MAG: hypothetical protein WCS42_08110 [Verrucomicrobiota bacterium]
MATDPIENEAKRIKAETASLLFKFVTVLHKTDAHDPFFQWLRDDQPITIEWGTFGIEKIPTESQR